MLHPWEGRGNSNTTYIIECEFLANRGLNANLLARKSRGLTKSLIDSNENNASSFGKPCQFTGKLFNFMRNPCKARVICQLLARSKLRILQRKPCKARVEGRLLAGKPWEFNANMNSSLENHAIFLGKPC